LLTQVDWQRALATDRESGRTGQKRNKSGLAISHAAGDLQQMDMAAPAIE
jgi:hypothetical protein